MRNDKRVELIFERDDIRFKARINALLAEGGWRVSETRVFHTDADFFAMLIQAEEATDEK